jgi:hypothetical protein
MPSRATTPPMLLLYFFRSLCLRCLNKPPRDTVFIPDAPELLWPNPRATKIALMRRIHLDEEELEPCIVEDEFRHSICTDRRKPTSRSGRNFPITRTHLLIYMSPTTHALSLVLLSTLAVRTTIHSHREPNVEPKYYMK